MATKKKSGIHIKKKNRGKLHRKTGTPMGQKIPESKIKKAEHSKNPTTRKEAYFADTAKHKFKHKKKARKR